MHAGETYGELYFTDVVKVGSTEGRYNKVTAAKLPEMAGEYNFNYNSIIIVLEFTDLAGNVV